MVRGTAAGFQGDTATARQAGRDFLSHYAAEREANRIEYREHEPAIAGLQTARPKSATP